MQAIQMTQYGEADVLQLKNLPTPKPKSGEALVRLKAAGINFIDIYQRRGRYSVTLPYIPGLEGAGVVEAIGEGVHEVKPGDRVAYTGQAGSYAEYNVVPVSQLIPLPEEITFEQGAAFPLQGMTAHYLLYDFYSIAPNDTVLIHAAAGGVGLLLVQWAKHLGARVIGTVSTPEKAKLVHAAGADHVILYTQQDFVAEAKKLTNNKGVDYIIDGVGKDTFTRDLDAVRVRGHICLFGSASGPAELLAPNSLQDKSITLSAGRLWNHLQTREELLHRAHAVLTGIRQGWLKLKIDHVLPLEQAAEAQRLLEGRQTTGKVILQID
jgi:NADPH2:quinone reductase